LYAQNILIYFFLAGQNKSRNGSLKSKEEEAKVPKKKLNQARTENKSSTFTHPWLLTSLKGHSSPVLSIDFSSNGKYLASCSAGLLAQVFHTKF